MARGFTLLEVIVATAVAAVLLSLLAQMMDGLRRGRSTVLEAGASGTAVMVDAYAVMGLLRDALPAPHNRPDISFVGRTNELRFAATAPQAWREAGTVRVAMKVEDDRAGTVRIVVEMAGTTGASAQPPSRHVLMSNLKSASFTFSEAASAVALPEWNDNARLPGLVRLDVAFEDQKVGPVTVVAAPRRQRVASCVLDLVSVECRRDS